MKLKRPPSGYLLSEEELNDLLAEPSIKSKKTKFTDLICSLMNYISLFPTIVYNVIWFFHMKKLLEQIGNDNLDDSIDLHIKGCSIIFNWANYIVSWTLVALIKGIILLVCSKMFCGNENDCNVLCLLIKTFTSLIPGIIFVLKIPDNISNYKILRINSDINQIDPVKKFHCDELANAVFLFYKWEYAYVIFLLFVFCFIPFGAVCMCLKEFWKSRGYTTKDE
jgi:hypothetical protein